MTVSRGKIVKNPDENCFDCGRHFDVLDYFICMNGEWQGHCMSCLEKLQGITKCSDEDHAELASRKYFLCHICGVELEK